MNYQNDSIRRQDRLLDQPEATELERLPPISTRGTSVMSPGCCQRLSTFLCQLFPA